MNKEKKEELSEQIQNLQQVKKKNQTTKRINILPHLFQLTKISSFLFLTN